MALTNVFRTACLSSCLRSTSRNFISILLLREKSIVVDLEDALDDFTTRLMQKKTDKWENLKIRKILPPIAQKPLINEEILGNKINEISVNELNSIFEKFLDGNDQHQISSLLLECTTYKRCPSDLILLNVLFYFSQNANIEGINQVEALCSITNPEYLKTNSNFKHYLAEALWLKGNITKAMTMFEEVYRQNAFLRRRIRLILKYLISDAVSNRSEAVLVNLVQFTENLCKTYNDYYPISCLWETCFLSEWFSDQTLAIDLLERNEGLRKIIANQIPYVVGISLKYHKIDLVYRFLEVLLKYDMKLQYSVVLVALFDYRFKQGDTKGCCEILNWSIKHKVMLPSIQHEKFLKLLLKCSSTEQKYKQHTTAKYELKF